MPSHFVRASGLYQQTGYAYAAIAPPGSLVLAAGACPIDETGQVVGGADHAAQADQTLTNLLTALAAAGPASPTCSKTRSTSSRPTSAPSGTWSTPTSPTTSRQAPRSA
jgi:enamine deaminase RidA (YjgF/YER057c/UK114 family)